MALIAITEREHGVYIINLTNSSHVWERCSFGDPIGALNYVWRLSEYGHKVALPTALARLKAAAGAYQPPTPAAD